MSKPQTILLTIQASAAPIWEGEVAAIEARNQEGPFTILPDHANFMTPIASVPVLITLPDGTQTTYEYEQAVLFLQNNHAKLYVHSEAEE